MSHIEKDYPAYYEELFKDASIKYKELQELKFNATENDKITGKSLVKLLGLRKTINRQLTVGNLGEKGLNRAKTASVKSTSTLSFKENNKKYSGNVMNVLKEPKGD